MTQIQAGDILEWAKNYKGEKFHALLCDPPYHLTSIVERFGKENAAPTKSGPHGRLGKGFMGQDWDGGDIAFRPETWAALAEHLHPGAFGLAFSGSRTWHRMAVAIEDAGLIIHPTVYVWAYGSGFPKASRIDNQVDRRMGAERKKEPNPKAKQQTGQKDTPSFGDKKANETLSRAGSAEGAVWEGHRYGAQALKPAAEPVIMFQKPYGKKPIESMLSTGAGALNIKAGRIGKDLRINNSAGNKGGTATYNMGKEGMPEAESAEAIGRWPANFVLSHHPLCRKIGSHIEEYAVNTFDSGAKPFGGAQREQFTGRTERVSVDEWECHEDCSVRALNEQTGVTGGGAFKESNARNRNNGANWMNNQVRQGKANEPDNYGDEGGGSRYFYNANFILDRLEDAFFYELKAATSEKEDGLFGKFPCTICGGLNTTRHLNESGEEVNCRRNPHPTIKPIDLIRHLASLLLPPEPYQPRRLLVPFAGVGSEVIAAWQAGWEFIQGVELKPDYAEVANARLDYWMNNVGVQLSMFGG